MRETYSKLSVWTLLLGAVGLAMLSGCGGSAYDSLVNRRLLELRVGAPFKILWGPTTLDETPISLRVPLVFRKSYRPDSGHSDDGGRIKPDRLQPPFLPLPGLKLCYEGASPDPGGGTLPFYCYVAVVPKGDAAKLQTELQAALKTTFPETPDTWESVDAKTPEEKAVPWKKIRVEGEQPFFAGPQKKPTMMPGIFELWIHGADDYVVLVGWRTPKSIEGTTAAQSQQDGLLQLRVQQATQGKLDLQVMPALTAGTLEVKQATEDAG